MEDTKDRVRIYNINDIRWTTAKSFAAGFTFAVFVLAGSVHLLLAFRGLIK